MHNCKAIIITCIDFRFQQFIDTWIKQHYHPGDFDRVALAGGVFDQVTVLKQIQISQSLHHIQEVILINHEDCSAYGKEGNYQRHIQDLHHAQNQIKLIYPTLDTKTFYLKLDGTFEAV